jgi:2'-5' RNA ligase
MPRLFFAIQTPPAIRAVLEDAQKELAALFDRDTLRLEHLENSHVTLAFLGEIAEASKPILIESASQSIGRAGVQPFEMSVLELQPNDKRRPKVIWATLEPAAKFATLHRAAEEAAKTVGVTLDHQTYHPHLTLARFRHTVKLGATSFPPLTQIRARVSEVVLIESELGYGPPRHTAIARFPLVAGHID